MFTKLFITDIYVKIDKNLITIKDLTNNGEWKKGYPII